MNLSQQEWSAKLELSPNAIIIDVRTAEECADGIIKNAINIDIFKGDEFINEVEMLDKSADYFVYCKAGSRSEHACAIMQSLGFSKTFNLVGGYMNREAK